MRRLIWILLATLTALSSAPPATAQAARGVIPDRVTVRGTEIQLLELAKVSGAPPEVQAQLEAARLGPSPRPGESITLPRSTVLTRLRSSVAGSAQVQWQIAERVTIQRASKSLQLPEIEAALRRYVERNMSVPVERLTIDAVQARTPLLLPEGQLELDFEAPAGDDLLGQTSLTLVARIDGEPAARLPVRARIDADVRVMVTSRALRRGQAIGESDVREEVRPASRAGAHPALNPSEVLGKNTKRALAANQPVDMDDVETPPSVRRGDPVLLIVRTDKLVVTCPGEAMQDGRIGDMVSVMNTTTRRELRGRLRPNGEVQIEYRSPATLSRSAP